MEDETRALTDNIAAAVIQTAAFATPKMGLIIGATKLSEVLHKAKDALLGGGFDQLLIKL